MVTPGRSKKLGTALASALGLLALLWLIYLGLTWDLRSSAREPDAAFEPVAVARGDLPETVVATGVLEPSARVVVQSEIPGIVAVVHIDDGERVTKGQALVELDRERLEDRVAELAAGLEMRRARARFDLVGHGRLLWRTDLWADRICPLHQRFKGEIEGDIVTKASDLICPLKLVTSIA